MPRHPIQARGQGGEPELSAHAPNDCERTPAAMPGDRGGEHEFPAFSRAVNDDVDREVGVWLRRFGVFALAYALAVLLVMLVARLIGSLLIH